MPAKSHGLNLPYLLLVHSMILPMIGSLKASKTRAPIIIPGDGGQLRCRQRMGKQDKGQKITVNQCVNRITSHRSQRISDQIPLSEFFFILHKKYPFPTLHIICVYSTTNRKDTQFLCAVFIIYILFLQISARQHLSQ